jgi:predicted nucleic acid-binding protein
MPTRKLIFVDTNIWLDFYRARTEAGLKLLDHLEKISGDLISSYQLEMEFKKNRQAAIMEGFQVLKSPDNISRPGIFSDAKAVKIIQDNIKAVSVKVSTVMV